jgi:hypothetical protein
MERTFTPNTKIVKVRHQDHTEYYEVWNVPAYIAKCIQDGKEAVYVGVTDEQGKLK